MSEEKVNKDKVKELASKARSDKAVTSNKDINDVLYGPQTENQQAAGVGEFDT